MIRLDFTAADLAGLRFAHSPMAEVAASAFALRGDAWMYASWRARVTPALAGLPTFAAVLAGPRGYTPDFLTPVPRLARPTLDDELRTIAATPLDRVAAQVTAGWTGHPEPPAVARFHIDPRGALDALVAEIRRYFAVAVAPLWPRLRGTADAEIAARARGAADRGPRVLVESLHPRLDWDGSALLIGYAHKHGRWGLDGHDLTLLPTGFAGGEVYSVAEAGAVRALWYAPRGFGNLWSAGPAVTGSSALAALLGPTRAAVLTLVAVPRSTGDVAAALGIAGATASHHLTTLRDAGLVASGRTGRRLLYERTWLGDRLATS